jgi:signal peptidase
VLELDELRALVPEPRQAPEPAAPDDDVLVKAIAVAVARPDLSPAGVAALLRQAGVDTTTDEVAAQLDSVDLAGSEDRTEFVALMAVRRPWWLTTGLRVLAAAMKTSVALSVLLLLFLAVLPRTGWYQTSTMLTGSMAPGIPVGAAILGVPERVEDVRVGQVVSLHAPVPGRPVVTHRVIAVVQQDGRTGLRTKGDANTSPDPYVAFPDDDRVWVVAAVVPGLGTLVRALQGQVAHAVLVVALPSLLAGWALVLLWRPRRAVRPCDAGSA